MNITPELLERIEKLVTKIERIVDLEHALRFNRTDTVGNTFTVYEEDGATVKYQFKGPEEIR